MEKPPKKKFKETKVGKFIIEKLPGFAAEVLPEKGVLGIIKNLIDKDPVLTVTEKKELNAELISMYQLEVADRDSARRREMEVAKTKKWDFMFNLTGIVGLLSFAFIIYAIVFLEIPADNKEVWIHLIGICEGIVLSIFGYFFGAAVKKE